MYIINKMKIALENKMSYTLDIIDGIAEFISITLVCAVRLTRMASLIP